MVLPLPRFYESNIKTKSFYIKGSKYIMEPMIEQILYLILIIKTWELYKAFIECVNVNIKKYSGSFFFIYYMLILGFLLYHLQSNVKNTSTRKYFWKKKKKKKKKKNLAFYYY